MTTLLGHGGLLVHQVPDLGMLQMLQVGAAASGALRACAAAVPCCPSHTRHLLMQQMLQVAGAAQAACTVLHCALLAAERACAPALLMLLCPSTWPHPALPSWTGSLRPSPSPTPRACCSLPASSST